MNETVRDMGDCELAVKVILRHQHESDSLPIGENPRFSTFKCRGDPFQAAQTAMSNSNANPLHPWSGPPVCRPPYPNTPEHYEPAFEVAFDAHRAELAAIVAKSASCQLCYYCGAFDFVPDGCSTVCTTCSATWPPPKRPTYWESRVGTGTAN